MAKKNNIYKENSKDGYKTSLQFIKKDKYFVDDKEARNIYRFKVNNHGKSTSFKFGDSIDNTRKGLKSSKNDVFGTIVTENQYIPESYNEFRDEYGYEDNKDSKKIYKNIKSNNEKFNKVFTKDEQDKLFKKYENF